MTIAICWKCGEKKWGALSPCGKCGSTPRREDDFATSIALSDHYFDEETLGKMGASVAAGERVTLDPALRESLIRSLRDARVHKSFLKDHDRASDIHYVPVRQTITWWKAIFRGK